MFVFSFLGVSALVFCRVWAVDKLDTTNWTLELMVSIKNGETTSHLLAFDYIYKC